MKKSLNIIIVLLTIFLNFNLVIGQKIDFQNPPKQENTYLFKVVKYHRQLAPPQYMVDHIEEIVNKPKTKWTAEDSLFYAYENVHLENFEMALSVFARIEMDTVQDPHAQMLYRTTLQHLQRYDMLMEYNQQNVQDDESTIYSIKDAMFELNSAFKKYKEQAFIPDSTKIFTILEQDTLNSRMNKKSPKNNIHVDVAFAIDSALRHATILNDDKNYILAKAFEEMGDYQMDYFYLTNAFFYYSAALHYYGTDQGIIEKYNDVADEITEQNYISISFKNNFGKIISNRYRMNTDYIEKEKIDSSIVPKMTPPPKKETQKDYLPWINNSILIMIILALALVFVLVFMKVKK